LERTIYRKLCDVICFTSAIRVCANQGRNEKKILYVDQCTPNDGSTVLACNKMLMQKLVCWLVFDMYSRASCILVFLCCIVYVLALNGFRLGRWGSRLEGIHFFIFLG